MSEQYADGYIDALCKEMAELTAQNKMLASAVVDAPKSICLIDYIKQHSETITLAKEILGEK